MNNNNNVNEELYNANNDNNDNNNLNENNKITTEFISFQDTYESVLKSTNKISIPYLTKYEKSRIIGIRAKQISKGSPCLVEVDNLTSPKDIALKELIERKIPIIIKRTMPNNNIEYWRIDELKFNFS